jgi:ribosomal protein S18 acetylase RimI-like enzyme
MDRHAFSDKNVQVRPAGPEDGVFIEELSSLVFRPFGSYGCPVRNWLDSGEALTLVALSRARPAAFAMISRLAPSGMDPRVTELLAIAVAPDEQRTGIGRFLLRRIQKEALKRKAEVIVLHTARENTGAQALFRAEGFHAVTLRPEFYPRGQDALLMIKDFRLNRRGPGARPPDF